MIVHPLAWIPSQARPRLFAALLALTLGLFGVFRLLDSPLRTPAAPNGVVSFELAGNPAQANAIIQSWDASAREYAAFGLGLDYLFMPAYALTLSLALLLTTAERPRLHQWGNWLGWGVLLAALFDAVENFSLWQILNGAALTGYPRLAALMATIKFAILLIGIAFVLLGWVLPKK